MGISLGTIRVGHKYRLKNFGNTTDFLVIEKLSETNYIIKDLTTLDLYEFYDLIQFGKTNDYELEEL